MQYFEDKAQDYLANGRPLAWIMKWWQVQSWGLPQSS
jgi:hypothetical protein